MNHLQLLCKTAIPNPSGAKLRGLAFDGHDFFLTRPEQSQIVRWDSCFCQCKEFAVGRPFNCICFDPKNCCFWAACPRAPGRVFQLNQSFQEIDCLTLRIREAECAVVSGLSFDCLENCLLVALGGVVVSLCLCDCTTEKLLLRAPAPCIAGVLSIAPAIITVEAQTNCQTVALYSGCGCIPTRLEPPPGFRVLSVLLNPCRTLGQRCPHFWLLATRHGGYLFLLECALEDPPQLADCNFSPCPCPEPCPEPPPCHGCRCGDLLESVALIETALAHILNAEGEKLQKVIACGTDVEQLLRVNEAVSQTILHITHLEIILHDKLDAIARCCGCGCRDCPCEECCECEPCRCEECCECQPCPCEECCECQPCPCEECCERQPCPCEECCEGEPCPCEPECSAEQVRPCEGCECDPCCDHREPAPPHTTI